MTKTLTEAYTEAMRERFEDILTREAWQEVEPFYMELEQDGYPELPPLFSQMMNVEELDAYRKWDKLVNGDSEVLADDNS